MWGGRARAEMVLGIFAETKVPRRTGTKPRNKDGFPITDVGNDSGGWAPLAKALEKLSEHDFSFLQILPKLIFFRMPDFISKI